MVTYNRMLRRSVQLAADDNDIAIRASTMQSFVWQDYKGRTHEQPPRGPLQNPFAYDWETMIRRLEDGGAGGAALVVDEGQDLPADFFVLRLAMRGQDPLGIRGRRNKPSVQDRSTLGQIKQAADLPNPTILSENHRKHARDRSARGALPQGEVTRSHRCALG